MKYTISKEIFINNPGYVRGIVRLKNTDNHGTDEQLYKMLESAEQDAMVRFEPDNLRNISYVANWREAFVRFGCNPNKYPPSIESLLKRVLKGNKLPYINKLVAIFNYISLKYVLPCGGDDLDRVSGNLFLTYAKGDEVYVPLNETSPSPVVPGEIIYRDDERVLCSKWVWRQGDSTKITQDSKNVIINIDGMPPVNAETVRMAMDEMSELIRVHCGGVAVLSVIDEEDNVFEFA